MISVSVGFKLRARTSVPSSEVFTWPFYVLSKRAKISLISFVETSSSAKKRVGWLGIDRIFQTYSPLFRLNNLNNN